MGKFVDLTGQKFGRLTVISRDENTKDGHATWLCKCECGNRKVISGAPLRRGSTKSCGCLQKERVKSSNTKHGRTKSPLYKVHREMLHRCQNKKAKNYKNYGGRGITVCEEWLEFLSFYRWALHNGYKHGLTIERIDVNGNYCPENCCWITIAEQQRNRRNTIRLSDGTPASLIAKKNGISTSLVRARIKIGWTIERAIMTPVGKRGRPRKSKKQKPRQQCLLMQ